MHDKPGRKSFSLFENLFIRYGAGSHFFLPLTRLKVWNTIAWGLIVLGVAIWAVTLWFCSTYTNQ